MTEDSAKFSVLMTPSDCSFLLNCGRAEWGLDLELKLSIARISDERTVTVQLSAAELSQMASVLTENRKHMPMAMLRQKQHAKKLAALFSQAMKEETVLHG